LKDPLWRRCSPGATIYPSITGGSLSTGMGRRLSICWVTSGTGSSPRSKMMSHHNWLNSEAEWFLIEKSLFTENSSTGRFHHQKAQSDKALTPKCFTKTTSLTNLTHNGPPKLLKLRDQITELLGKGIIPMSMVSFTAKIHWMLRTIT